MNRQFYPGFLALLLFLSGCASVQQRIDEMNQPTPRALDASPAQTGLLVIDVGLKHKGSLSFGIESSVDVLGGAVRRADTREEIRQGTMKQLLVFQLPPGRYELVSVRGHFRAGKVYHTVEPFLVNEVGPIEVVAGEVTYVGRLTATAQSRLGQLGFTYAYAWDRNPSRETTALQLVAAQYPDSPWAPVIERRRAKVAG